MRVLHAAVIGAGTMGCHHVRVLDSLPDVDVTAIVDVDAGAAERATPRSGTSVLDSIEDLPIIDLAVVATPTPTHFGIASDLISRGVHVLVEKPLAPTVEEAERLVRAAKNASVVLAVGHVERFNAAFGLLRKLIDTPVLLSFERLSPFTPRIGDSIVMDLMVHDLDLAMWLVGAYPIRVAALGAGVFTDTCDVATAVLEFESGCIATLQASRATQDKVRRICVSERDRFIVADSIRQDVSIKREATATYSDDDGAVAYRQASVVEIPYLDRSGEPLVREVRDFVDSVRQQRAPEASGRDGALAVKLAKEIEAAIDSGQALR